MLLEVWYNSLDKPLAISTAQQQGYYYNSYRYYNTMSVANKRYYRLLKNYMPLNLYLDLNNYLFHHSPKYAA